MRSNKVDPTEDMLQEILQEVDPNQTGDIDIEQLMKVVHRRLEDIWEPIFEAFRVFDPNNTGFIHTNELQRVMRSLGGDLNTEEVKNIVHGRVSLQINIF